MLENAVRDVATGKYVAVHYIPTWGALAETVFKDQAVRKNQQTVFRTAYVRALADQIACNGAGISKVSEAKWSAVTLSRFAVTCQACMGTLS